MGAATGWLLHKSASGAVQIEFFEGGGREEHEVKIFKSINFRNLRGLPVLRGGMVSIR